MTNFATYPNIGTQENLIDVFNEIAYNLNVNYLFGSIDEIVAQLETKKQAAVSRFPFVALVLPFTEQQGNGWDTSVNDFKFMIGCLIETPGKLFKDRYDANYKGILYPIYTKFLAILAQSGYFREVYPEQIVHQKTDASNNDAGIPMPDYIDFVWIYNMKLNKIGKEPKL